MRRHRSPSERSRHRGDFLKNGFARTLRLFDGRGDFSKSNFKLSDGAFRHPPPIGGQASCLVEWCLFFLGFSCSVERTCGHIALLPLSQSSSYVFLDSTTVHDVMS